MVIGGRLFYFSDSWEAINASPSVLSLVQGVHLEFNSPPPLMHAVCAPDSAKGVSTAKCLLLRKEVRMLIQKKAIECAPAQIGFYTRIFLVPPKKWQNAPSL